MVVWEVALHDTEKPVEGQEILVVVEPECLQANDVDILRGDVF